MKLNLRTSVPSSPPYDECILAVIPPSSISPRMSGACWDELLLRCCTAAVAGMCAVLLRISTASGSTFPAIAILLASRTGGIRSSVVKCAGMFASPSAGNCGIGSCTSRSNMSEDAGDRSLGDGETARRAREDDGDAGDVKPDCGGDMGLVG